MRYLTNVREVSRQEKPNISKEEINSPAGNNTGWHVWVAACIEGGSARPGVTADCMSGGFT